MLPHATKDARRARDVLNRAKSNEKRKVVGKITQPNSVEKKNN